MNNHLDRLHLNRSAHLGDVVAALEDSALDEEENREARGVLLDPFRRLHFERVHRQYEALAAARRMLLNDQGTDTHRWPERLIEFEPG